MINSAAVQPQASTDAYTDFSHVNAIGALKDKNQALEKIAQQFESMMLRMMMKSMRSANKVFAEGNFLSSHEGDTYRGMLDDQLALTLSQGKGIGLAEVMVRQLKGRFGKADTKDSYGPDDNLEEYFERSNDYAVPVDVIANYARQHVNYSTGDRHSSRPDKTIEFDGSIDDFVEKIYPLAEKAAVELGVDPEVLIAQSALETGWGLKVSRRANGSSSFNFFNIKADQRWQGDSVSVATMEVRNGLAVREVASFRAYTAPEKSFEDYVEFVSNSSRYSQAVQSTSAESYIRNLSAAGYATDPDYADKVLQILNNQTLRGAVKKLASQEPLALSEF